MPSRSDVNPWVQAQEHLQQILDEYSYKNWFSQTTFQSYEDGQLVVSVPSEFFAEWLRDHYLDAICEAVRIVLPDFREVAFAISQETMPPTVAPPSGASAPALLIARKKVKTVRSFSGFNPRYTFDRFVIGSETVLRTPRRRRWPNRRAARTIRCFCMGVPGLARRT